GGVRGGGGGGARGRPGGPPPGAHTPPARIGRGFPLERVEVDDAPSLRVPRILRVAPDAADGAALQPHEDGGEPGGDALALDRVEDLGDASSDGRGTHRARAEAERCVASRRRARRTAWPGEVVTWVTGPVDSGVPTRGERAGPRLKPAYAGRQPPPCHPQWCVW